MKLLHELILSQAKKTPQAEALGFKDTWLTYQELADQVTQASEMLRALQRHQRDRVAVYLPKVPQAVMSYFGASMAGLVFVPINPILKAPQATHIIQDAQATVLITNSARLKTMSPDALSSLKQVILIDEPQDTFGNIPLMTWDEAIQLKSDFPAHRMISTDLVALLYTSGSTGKPKGVMLSHQNMVTGAYSVAEYLDNQQTDRLLCALPFSFDYGFSQMTISFATGGSCYLMEYLFPQDILKQVVAQKITGLALVPALWIKLARMAWPESTREHLRYFTNTGGAMPVHITKVLREQLPNTKPYLMYGLTEAFRSCYLPPEQVDIRPGSIGQTIPNAEILVINEKGECCQPEEPGELVHRGPLVSLGYWKNEEKTQERFQPLPKALTQGPLPEIAVWSGDTVKIDSEGYLYFIGRTDEMIKTSGYRVSPQEVEELVYQSGLVKEAIVIGVPHDELGQAILLFIIEKENVFLADIQNFCRKNLPSFMIPQDMIALTSIVTNANGKPDRAALNRDYKHHFCKGEKQ
ncbi:acyl-CoA ligase (AMP-forming), exosortase A system-associated [Algicola sagamiensis]|uniref:acyl-CoA ligase (AMP-forming), exosortase A system-associated n=1 Tax=Algicola sagamiensis TaxID=163869 RepID=UPI00035DFB99|nr:acyl-CoA ligase (AMP-forming), exosortase A system-associated [Algicola sagamiensis]